MVISYQIIPRLRDRVIKIIWTMTFITPLLPWQRDINGQLIISELTGTIWCGYFSNLWWTAWLTVCMCMYIEGLWGCMIIRKNISIVAVFVVSYLYTDKCGFELCGFELGKHQNSSLWNSARNSRTLYRWNHDQQVVRIGVHCTHSHPVECWNCVALCQMIPV